MRHEPGVHENFSSVINSAHVKLTSFEREGFTSWISHKKILDRSLAIKDYKT